MIGSGPGSLPAISDLGLAALLLVLADEYSAMPEEMRRVVLKEAATRLQRERSQDTGWPDDSPLG